MQALVYVLHSSHDLVSLLIWTYCFISCSLSLADGAVHWQIKYCNGTAKASTTNCRTRGISANLLQISLPCHKDLYRSKFLCHNFFFCISRLRYLLRRRVETRSPWAKSTELVVFSSEQRINKLHEYLGESSSAPRPAGHMNIRPLLSYKAVY